MSWHKVADGSKWGPSEARWVLENQFGHPARDPLNPPDQWVDWVAEHIWNTMYDQDHLDPFGLMREAQAWASEVLAQWTDDKWEDGWASPLPEDDDAPAEEDDHPAEDDDGMEEYQEEEYDPFGQYIEDSDNDAPAEEAENDDPSEDATIPEQLSFYEFLTSDPAQKKQKASSPRPWHHDSEEGEEFPPDEGAN